MVKAKFLVLAAVLATAVAGCTDPYGNNYGGGYGNAGYGNAGYGGGYGAANSPTNSAAIRTLGGAAAGAVIADATGGSKTRGAMIGALAGGVSCGVPGLPACH